jgi:hypothetical protein
MLLGQPRLTGFFSQNVKCTLSPVCPVHVNWRQSSFCMFCWLASLYNLVNRTNLCTIFLNIFIVFLYMFRATMCPSSEEKTVPMRHLVFVTLYRYEFLSAYQTGMCRCTNVMYKWNHTGSHPGTLYITLPLKNFKNTTVFSGNRTNLVDNFS